MGEYSRVEGFCQGPRMHGAPAAHLHDRGRLVLILFRLLLTNQSGTWPDPLPIVARPRPLSSLLCLSPFSLCISARRREASPSAVVRPASGSIDAVVRCSVFTHPNLPRPRENSHLPECQDRPETSPDPFGGTVVLTPRSPLVLSLHDRARRHSLEKTLPSRSGARGHCSISRYQSLKAYSF